MRLSGERLKFNQKFIFLIAQLINIKMNSKIMSNDEKRILAASQTRPRAEKPPRWAMIPWKA